MTVNNLHLRIHFIFSEQQFEKDRKNGRDRRSPIRAPRAKTESPVESEESEGEG